MLALPLPVVLVGGLQASAWAIGRELQRRTLAAVIVITLVTTLVVVRATRRQRGRIRRLFGVDRANAAYRVIVTTSARGDRVGYNIAI